MRLWFSGPRLFGIRPGISVSLDELMGRRRAATSGSNDCSFVYVIKDESRRIKIGSSGDPSRRLKELQTGHPERLSIEFIGAATIDGAIIESAAHTALYRYRINNEWFSVSTEYAIAAIYGVAANHDAKIKQVSEKEAQQIMRIMTGLETMPNNGRERNRTLWALALLVWILLILILIAPAHAGPHFENGHWIVTSDKREKQFWDCIDNPDPYAQEMDAVTEKCLNEADESERCKGKINSYFKGQLPCLAELKSPKWGGDN